MPECPACQAKLARESRFCPECGCDIAAFQSETANESLPFDFTGGQRAAKSAPVASTEPAAPQGKRGHGCLWAVLIVLAIIGVVFLVLIFAPSGDTGTRTVSAPKSQLASVIYRVKGSAHVADVTYETEQGGTAQEEIGVPWQRSASYLSGAYVYISAQKGQGGADVTCQIIVNGKVYKETTSSGEYVIATCSGTVP